MATDADEIIELERPPSPLVSRANVDYLELKQFRPACTGLEVANRTAGALKTMPNAADADEFGRRPSMAAVLFRKLRLDTHSVLQMFSVCLVTLQATTLHTKYLVHKLRLS
jgi:hypothetical protein